MKLGELRPEANGMIVASSVGVGSLAACPSCGGLVVLERLVLLVSARHLTGDERSRSCPRRGVGWSTSCYE